MISPNPRPSKQQELPWAGKSPDRASQRSGFMLIDVLVALLIVVIGFSALLGSLLASHRLRDDGRETALAYEAIRTQLEEMRAMPFREVFAFYNDTEIDDLPGPVAAPGAGFAIVGLTPRADDEDGWVGKITFPVAPGAPAILREDIEIDTLRMPRDLSADQAIDGVDHAADYILLPVQVLVEWQSSSGPRSLGIETLLAAR